MATTIGCLSPKGGVMKTGLTAHLAYMFNKTFEVCVIDADESKCITRWGGGQEDLTIVGDDSAQIHKTVKKLSKSFDYIFVDGPPNMSKATASQIMACDLILVPAASLVDVRVAMDIVDLIMDRQKLMGTPEAYWVLTKAHPQHNIHKEVVQLMGNSRLPLLKFDGRDYACTERTAYAWAGGEGQTVFDREDKIAHEEMKSVYKTLKTLIVEKEVDYV